MAWCRDFGSRIADGCDHAMRADSDSCHCDECGVVCLGRFEACPSIWARGPQPVTFVVAPVEDPLEVRLFGPRAVNGHDPAVSVADGHEAGDKPNGSGATPSDPSSTPPTSATSGVDVLRWFQTSFDALRDEVQGLRTALTQEQAVVARLLDERSTETVDVEALSAAVTAAVRQTMRSQAEDLRIDIIAAVRRDIEAVKLSQDEHAAGMQSSMASVAAASAALPVAAQSARCGQPQGHRGDCPRGFDAPRGGRGRIGRTDRARAERPRRQAGEAVRQARRGGGGGGRPTRRPTRRRRRRRRRRTGAGSHAAVGQAHPFRRRWSAPPRRTPSGRRRNDD